MKHNPRPPLFRGGVTKFFLFLNFPSKNKWAGGVKYVCCVDVFINDDQFKIILYYQSAK